MRGHPLATASGICVLVCSTGFADEREIVRAPAFRASALNRLPTKNWITNGGNLANQRYSPLTAINRDRISARGLARGSFMSHRFASFCDAPL
jgi:glucose dehydrogenase